MIPFLLAGSYRPGQEEADTEQRRQTYESRTAKQQRRNARSERWIDRVNGANVRSKQEHKPAEAAAEDDGLPFQGRAGLSGQHG
jgi:hypothetical protein